MAMVVAENAMDDLLVAEEQLTISHSSGFLLVCARAIALVSVHSGRLCAAHEYMVRRVLRIQGYRSYLSENGTDDQKAVIKESDGTRDLVSWSYIITKLGAHGRQPFFVPKMYSDFVDLSNKTQLLEEIEPLNQEQQQRLLQVLALAIIVNDSDLSISQRLQTSYRVSKSMAGLYSDCVQMCRGKFPANAGALEASARMFARCQSPTLLRLEEIATGVDDSWLAPHYAKTQKSCKKKFNFMFLPEAVQFKCRASLSASGVEPLITLVILSNSVMLGVFHPNLVISDEYRNAIGFADVGFTIFYTLEAVMRVAANGFFYASTTREPAYFDSGWNKLDLTVILIAYVTYVLAALGIKMPVKPNVFRALRVLRLLHAVRFFSSTRAILTSLGKAIGLLGNVVALFMFFFCVYTVLGMSLFGGALRMSCIVDSNDLKSVGHSGGSIDMFKWGGEVGDKPAHCPPSLVCGEAETCAIHSEGGRGGYAGFDNAMVSLLSIFVATTGDNWNEIAWALLDSTTNTNWFGWLFLLSISFFCSLIALNIFVAVVCAVFGDVRGDAVNSAFSEEAALGYYDSDEDDDDNDMSVDMNESFHSWEVPRPRDWTRPFYHSDKMEMVTESPLFEAVVTLAIIANTGTMAAAYHGMPQSYFDTLEWCEYLFLSIFLAEMLLKVTGLGLSRYWSSTWNKMDMVVNTISVGALLFSSAEPQATAPRMLRLFRIVRATRVARLLEKSDSLRRLIRAVSASSTAIVNLYVFIVFSLCVTSLFGMHLLGDLKQYEKEGLEWVDEGTGRLNTIPRTTFDNFLMAFSSSFLMMTGDRWKGTMYTYMQTHGAASALFFIIVFVIMSCILLNLFVAVVLENFGLDDLQKINEQMHALEKSMQPVVIKNNWRRLAMSTPLKNCIDSVERKHGQQDGVALFIFTPKNPLRVLCTKVLCTKPKPL